jgi:hypothetical protein
LQAQLLANVFDGLPPQSVRIIVNVEKSLGVPLGWNENYYYNRVNWTELSGIPASRGNGSGTIKISDEKVEEFASYFSKNVGTQTWVNILAHEGIWGDSGGQDDCLSCSDGDIGAGSLVNSANLFAPFTVSSSSRLTLRSAFGF